MKRLNARFILFVLCLLLGLILRLNGITWGIPIDSINHTPLHPDEVWAMSVLSQLNIDNLDFNPEEAHREGTLAYFIWGIGAYLLKLSGWIQNTPYIGQPYNHDYSSVLLMGRIVTIFADVLSGVLIFLTVNLCTRQFIPSLIGMLIFFVTPFEVIHSHYMRTHVIANTFICSVIYFSFRLATSNSPILFLIIGLLSGLGIATRYPTGAILIVPASIILYKSLNTHKSKFFTATHIKRFFLNYGSLLIIIGLSIGLFIGVPFLFLDFESAKPHLFHQATYAAHEEFTWIGLLKLDRLAIYINYLIPYGSLPLLWILFYSSIALLLIFRMHLKYVISLICFICVYLYLMAKGYFASAIFIRAAIPIFPPLAICCGLALDATFQKFSNKVRITATLLYLVFIIPSILYLVSYTNSMKSDARIDLAKHIRETWNRKTLRIGAYTHSHNYITIKPAFDGLKNYNITLTERDSFANTDNSDIDFLVLSSFEYSDYVTMKERSNWLKKSGKFRKIKAFNSDLNLYGISYNYDRNPHDLSYPLVSLELWKRN